MKSVVWTSLLAVAFLVWGCDKKSGNPAPSTNTTASGTSPLDAPGGYLNELVKGQQSAVKTVDTTSINKAIELFNVDQGRYPKDLNELVQKKFLPQLPAAPYGMKLVYDANAGTVKVEKQ